METALQKQQQQQFQQQKQQQRDQQDQDWLFDELCSDQGELEEEEEEDGEGEEENRDSENMPVGITPFPGATAGGGGAIAGGAGGIGSLLTTWKTGSTPSIIVAPPSVLQPATTQDVWFHFGESSHSQPSAPTRRYPPEWSNSGKRYLPPPVAPPGNSWTKLIPDRTTNYVHRISYSSRT